ncbi:MAG: hypothetical protein PVS3B1_39610 [Ktedonobacteraceae bacterium]
MQKENSSAHMERKIRCILFDLGDTLWTRDDRDGALMLAVTQNAIQTIRAHVAPEVFARVDLARLNTQLYSTVITKAREFVIEHPYYEPDCGQLVNDALAQFGLPQLERSLSEAIFEDLRIPTLGSRHLFDDALSTLAELKRRGFLLGVVTNRYWGGSPFLASVQKLGLFDYFEPETMAISADLGIRKPNPDIFRHALNALHADPQESAMVGDSLYADIMGAKGLNMLTIWKPQLYRRTEQRALLADNPQVLDDDDALFSYVAKRDNEQYHNPHNPPRPDFTIKDLHELLNIFVEVGDPVRTVGVHKQTHSSEINGKEDDTTPTQATF